VLCCICYTRRRQFVKALDAAESPLLTKCIVLGCCPCSETQQFRELVNSGIWPGLMCCTASAADRAAMEPSAVRQRYSVGNTYGVRAKPGSRVGSMAIGSTPAHRLAGPVIGWSMA
jgi:hypothetical protein